MKKPNTIERSRTLLNKKWVKWGIIPVFFISLWLVLSVFKTLFAEESLTVIAEDYTKNNIQNYRTTDILKGERLSGTFTAGFDNLGIVAIRFNTHIRINNDMLAFRIKDSQSSDWFYTNTYDTNQFQPQKFFTFGFPVISDSKGKTYIFEIQSTNGRKNNAVALSAIQPIFRSKYQYSFSELKDNPVLFFSFTVQKATNILSDKSFAFASLIYLSPLVLYILWNSRLKNLHKKVHIINIVALSFVLIDLIFMDLNILLTDAEVIIIMALWLWGVIANKYESSISFVVAFFLLLFCPLLLIINLDTHAQRFAAWAYLFLVAATIQCCWELYTKQKSVYSAISIWKELQEMVKK